MSLISYVQAGFVGMNQGVDSSLLPDGELALLVNGRLRDHIVEPVALPQLLDLADQGVTPGKIQGIYAAAFYLVLFVDGKAYFRNFNVANSKFTQIAGFQLNPLADIIYAELVPESYKNYARVSSDGQASGTISLTATQAASPQCLVCQDGTSQPWIILSDGTARVSKTYAEWAIDNREYVPVGLQMLYSDGILYIVSPDGRRIYHSVTGRPLDFAVVVDTAANKAGDAEQVAHRVDFEAVSAIRPISSAESGFLCCTERASYIVKPRRNDLFFGEPTFSNQSVLPVGAKNQFSVIDILGDTAIIDFSGIKSFNAVLQTSNEGKNSVFSSAINRMFKGITQVAPCCAHFDNYALFSVKTTYGDVIVVYDTITQKFVSIDQLTLSGSIVQFAEVKTTLTRKLFARLSDNTVYELYSEDTTTRELCQVYLGDFTSKQPKVELKPNSVKLVFLNVRDSGTVYATPFTDNKRGATLLEDIIADTYVETSPLPIPFGIGTKDTSKSPLFTFTDISECWKFGVLVAWSFRADLSFSLVDVEKVDLDNSTEQAAKEWKYNSQDRPRITLVTPTTTIVNGMVGIHGTGLSKVTGVYLDNDPVASYTINNDSLIFFKVTVAGTYKVKVGTADGFSYAPTDLVVT
jgi:hypothetical protein